MSINFGQETVTVNPKDYGLVEDMVSDFDESVVIECHVEGMNADILRRSENLSDLNPQDFNALIRFSDFFMYNDMNRIRDEVHMRTELLLVEHQDLLDLEGVSHPIMDLFFEGTDWNISVASYHPLLELLNPYVTFIGYNEGIIKKMNIRSLDLSCSYIEDVTLLGKVHTLNLEYTNVTDLSALGGVHTLKLSSRSSLIKTHTIGLSHTATSNVFVLDDYPFLQFN